jgi:PAS domain S-box-containing protein
MVKNVFKTEHFGLSFDVFANIIDNLHDEIIVYDHNYKIIYINNACMRHYGFRQEEMIGKSFWHFINNNIKNCWDNSVLPSVYKLKRPIKQEQTTHLGAKLFTIATPMVGRNGDVQYVPMSVRDDFHETCIERLCDLKEREESPGDAMPGGMVCRSPAMSKVLELAGRVAALGAPCLLQGESGCGKSLMAKYIHQHSKRAGKPFVVVNCAGIPNELFESELFGHVRGSFTGATANKTGLFFQAEGGTLMLDEISELPLPMQAKLLHVLQEKEYRMIGGITSQRANVTVLAASNRNLRKMVDQGTFREDLFYRLNVVEIDIPPLRERHEDLLPLAGYFLRHYGAQYHKGKNITGEALDLLKAADWPGNVRELAHVIERLIVTVPGGTITAGDLPPFLLADVEDRNYSKQHIDLDEALAEYERRLVLSAFAKAGSTRKVAAMLRISQSKASRLLRKHLPQRRGESQ